MVRTGVTRAFGARLRRVLATGAKDRFRAFGLGFGVTALLQSSTATALIVSSFAGKQMVSGMIAIAILLGADVGTTLVAQFLSFDPKFLSPVLVVLGVAMFMSADAGTRRHIGRVFIGLGLALLSLKLIFAASAPLRESELLVVLVEPLASDPFIAVVIAAGLTWLAHSSLAIVLLVSSLTAAGVLPLDLAVVLVVGANVGGAIAPLLITARGAPEERRPPLGNFLMRLVGAAAALPLLDLAMPYVLQVDADPARAAVNFHTAFNIAIALVFLPFVGLVDKVTRKLLPDVEAGMEANGPRHLDQNALDEPSEALACAARETLRMGDEVSSMLRRVIEVFRNNDSKLAERIVADDDKVDTLYEAIKIYLTQLSRRELDEREGQRYVEVLTFTTNLEHVGDIIDKNLMELASKKIKNRYDFSPEGMAELAEIHAQVLENLDLAFNVFMSNDIRMARRLLEQKTAMRHAEQRASDHHLNRLREGRPETIETSSIHLDVVRDLKRVNSHLTSVAYPILEASGQLSDSRLVVEGRRGGTSDAEAKTAK